MKRILGIIVLGLLLFNVESTDANAKVLECKQIMEITDDISEDIIIKHRVKINLDSKSIEKYCTSCNNADKTLYKILKATDVSIEAESLAGLLGEQYLELNRYTLELIYRFYEEDAAFQGGSVFECDKLEKKI